MMTTITINLTTLLLVLSLPFLGLASWVVYTWWMAPPKLDRYVFDSNLDYDQIDALVSRRRRGTHGRGRTVKRPEPIFECSLVGDAAALLVGSRRTASVFRDVQIRLQALVKLEGCTINSIYYGPKDFSSTHETFGCGSSLSVSPVVDSERLLSAILWSIHEAKVSDQVFVNRLTLVSTWVDDWMLDQDASTIRGGLYRARLTLEWRLRLLFGLSLELPTQ